jgi:hypothetical protein
MTVNDDPSERSAGLSMTAGTEVSIGAIDLMLRVD